jgi:hypothetical protein
LPKSTGTCTSNEVKVGCLQACECGAGTVCCGVLNGAIVDSECQAVPANGHCQPYPQTSTQASAQLCKVTSECIGGQSCISQTCVLGAKLNICGLQSQAPFNCTAN